MQADGGHAQRLTNHPAVDKASSWSPDGSFLAFTSDRRGNFDIILVAIIGSMAATSDGSSGR